MPDIWLDVDAALSEVPVNILPLIDDADFRTREVAIAFDAPGMDLVWNFITTTGVFTQTAVVPTSGGNYDWVHQGDGIYTIEIPASGGASINNDTEGFGWFSGVATGVLPWRGPICGFRPASINNAMIDDTASGLERISRSTKGIVVGTVGTGSTVTSIVTSTLDPSATVADQFKGRMLTFENDTTTAALRGQSTDIIFSSAAGVLTVTALTSAPVNGDKFVIT